MSHCAQQIRAWFVTSLTGVSGLPTAHAGYVAQVAAGASSCTVTTTIEEIQPATMHTPPIDTRRLEVEVLLKAATLDAVDALGLAAEEALAAATGFPGKEFEPQRREYQENVETDRVSVSLTITYAATYDAARNDLETFK